MRATQIGIPTLVRIKPGALDRVGIYARRAGLKRVWLLTSRGLPDDIPARARDSLSSEGIDSEEHEVESASFEEARALLEALPGRCSALVGLGGGRALDTAKYVAHLAGLPYLAVPTSLSNDGFASPTASLTLSARRRSLASSMPFGVVVDTEVCLQAPQVLWLSGVGDLVAKLTAVHDWKLAFHQRGTPVNDFAALLSDATVHQFLARPERDLEGLKLLATALMLNGVSIGVAGSSRPASGSEHLISHALDRISKRPRLHGLQVGVASYLMACLQGQAQDEIRDAFTRTGFWQAIRADPFSRQEWLEAVRLAPELKDDFHTILSVGEPAARVAALLDADPSLQGCFHA